MAYQQIAQDQLASEQAIRKLLEPVTPQADTVSVPTVSEGSQSVMVIGQDGKILGSVDSVNIGGQTFYKAPKFGGQKVSNIFG